MKVFRNMCLVVILTTLMYRQSLEDSNEDSTGDSGSEEKTPQDNDSEDSTIKDSDIKDSTTEDSSAEDLYYDDFDRDMEIHPSFHPLGGVVDFYPHENSRRIIGGEAIDITSFPFMAGLVITKSNSKRTLCGGSIITHSVIVTAAHCFRSYSSGIAHAGSTDMMKGSHRKINQYIIHPKYRCKGYDIALAKVIIPFGSSNAIQRASYYGASVLDLDAILAPGWGTTSEGGKVTLNQLRYVRLPVQPQSKCKKYLNSKLKFDSETEFCTGFDGGTHDTCQGDSGGPAVISGNLAGIVSRGIGCARPKSYGIWTNIRPFISWIQRNT